MRVMDNDQEPGGNATGAGPRTKVLKNGAVYDLDRGRIVSSKGVINKWDSRTSAEAAAAKIQRKRSRLAAGANAVVAEGGKYDGRGLDFIEAVGEAAAITALNPDSSQQIKAAEFLLRETGLSERQQQQQEAGSVSGVASLVAELAQFAASIGQLVASSVDIISISSTDNDTPASASSTLLSGGGPGDGAGDGDRGGDSDG